MAKFGENLRPDMGIPLNKSFKRFRLVKYEKKCPKIFEKMKFFPLPLVLEFYEGELFS